MSGVFTPTSDRVFTLVKRTLSRATTSANNTIYTGDVVRQTMQLAKTWFSCTQADELLACVAANRTLAPVAHKLNFLILALCSEPWSLTHEARRVPHCYAYDFGLDCGVLTGTQRLLALREYVDTTEFYNLSATDAPNL